MQHNATPDAAKVRLALVEAFKDLQLAPENGGPSRTVEATFRFAAPGGSWTVRADVRADADERDIWRALLKAWESLAFWLELAPPSGGICVTMHR